jgi:hypothetical protein
MTCQVQHVLLAVSNQISHVSLFDVNELCQNLLQKLGSGEHICIFCLLLEVLSQFLYNGELIVNVYNCTDSFYNFIFFSFQFFNFSK